MGTTPPVCPPPPPASASCLGIFAAMQWTTFGILAPEKACQLRKAHSQRSRWACELICGVSGVRPIRRLARASDIQRVKRTLRPRWPRCWVIRCHGLLPLGMVGRSQHDAGCVWTVEASAKTRSVLLTPQPPAVAARGPRRPAHRDGSEWGFDASGRPLKPDQNHQRDRPPALRRRPKMMSPVSVDMSPPRCARCFGYLEEFVLVHLDVLAATCTEFQGPPQCGRGRRPGARLVEGQRPTAQGRNADPRSRRRAR